MQPEDMKEPQTDSLKWASPAIASPAPRRSLNTRGAVAVISKGYADVISAHAGIFGMDFHVVEFAPGARVARRWQQKARIGFSHRWRAF
ncbi:hypothetical protein C8J57DRAFT_1519362 [Mycena rebaudengoi]|nr:hypothetical protein C8J57DRAFT_1519362 [Mycena rebaudengoi]